VTTTKAEPFLERLEAERAHLERLAKKPPPEGPLTQADEPSGEQWDWGQVWAHMAEFPAYWMARLREVFAQPPARDPLPFGRTKADPDRIAAIEWDRHVPTHELMVRLGGDLDDLRDLLSDMSATDWSRRVRHISLGEMDMPRVFEEFFVGHLEAHTKQLDGLLPPG
jgi:hypothetical protein